MTTIKQPDPYQTARERLRGVYIDPNIERMQQRVVDILRETIPTYDWVGIYLVKGDDLVLGAWRGPQATEHVRIPIGQGICGWAAQHRETVVVDDVNEDPRYLACFTSTRAEIVVPIMRDGVVYGEIDVDGDQKGAFGRADQELLEEIATELAAVFAGRRAATTDGESPALTGATPTQGRGRDMMAGPGRVRVSTGTIWEREVGYSRAVRVGDMVFVAGTTATTRDGGFVGEGDPYAQTKQILANIQWALEQAGASLADVVRYRAYVQRLEDWQEVGRALGEVFRDVRPAGTLFGVSWYVDPRMLVEIDVDAVVGSAAPVE